MIEEFVQTMVYNTSYFQIMGLVFIYFLFLYFGLAPIFQAVCQKLAKNNLLQQIVPGEISKEQKKFELKHSFVSIIFFGFSGIPIIYLIRMEFITILPNTVFSVLIGVVILTIWNEIHFFVIHRMMHLPFFMKRVHYIHHKSKVPSVYSVYSFHWVEAFLLSTVPVTIAPFISFAPLAFVIYPLVSILLNYAGHCNYRFGVGKGRNWQLIATNHNEHHFKGKHNYGFASDLLDRLNGQLKTSNKDKRKQRDG